MGKKKLLAMSAIALSLLLGGCNTLSGEQTPLDKHVEKQINQYESDQTTDARFANLVEENFRKMGAEAKKPGEEYIKYGKTICKLLDHSEDVTASMKELDSVVYPISTAAIEVYCPHHLDEREQ